jgi:hypothetical protein
MNHCHQSICTISENHICFWTFLAICTHLNKEKLMMRVIISKICGISCCCLCFLSEEYGSSHVFEDYCPTKYIYGINLFRIYVKAPTSFKLHKQTCPSPDCWWRWRNYFQYLIFGGVSAVIFHRRIFRAFLIFQLRRALLFRVIFTVDIHLAWLHNALPLSSNFVSVNQRYWTRNLPCALFWR